MSTGLTAVPGVSVYPVVMAGGAGVRFWPLSRRRRPKQLLSLMGENSLLEMTVERLAGLAPADQILVVTSESIENEVRRVLPGLPAENVLSEPSARNTAAAIGYAAMEAFKRDPNAVLAVMPSDHFIAEPATFTRVSQEALRYAERGHIVTLGVTPTRPETGYGYIRFADFVTLDEEDDYGTERSDIRPRSIAAFVEKPSLETALSYLKEGRYLWNSGMFFFKASVILEEIERFLPDLAEGLGELRVALENEATPQEKAAIYNNLRAISIDFGVMEHTDKIVVIPCNMGWSDVGSWSVFDDTRATDVDNTVHGQAVVFDAKDNVIFADNGHMIGAVGVEGLVVAVSGGAVLVCPKERAQDVRRVVDEMQKRGMTSFL